MIFALILAATPIALPADINRRVTVDGREYRLRVKGRTVGVFNKSGSWARNPEMLARMIEVVRQATGCEVVRPGWSAGMTHMEGLLECPARD